MLKALTGRDYTNNELLTIGERSWNLVRAFNIKAGLKRKDDTLPNRLLKETLPFGPSKGYTVNLAEMLNEYYELRKWNEASGDIPQILSFQMGAVAGISYHLPANSEKTMWICPEIYYSLGFTDIAEATPWTVNTLFVGLTFIYSPSAVIRKADKPAKEPVEEVKILAKELEIKSDQGGFSCNCV